MVVDQGGGVSDPVIEGEDGLYVLLGQRGLALARGQVMPPGLTQLTLLLPPFQDGGS